MSEQNSEAFTDRLSLEEAQELLKEIHVEQVANQFSNRVITLVVASLGLTTALAWDETLRELFHVIFGPADDLGHKLLYSLLITAIAVVATIILARLLNRRSTK